MGEEGRRESTGRGLSASGVQEEKTIHYESILICGPPVGYHFLSPFISHAH